MSARKRQPNKDFVAIAEQLAAELVANLEAAGYPLPLAASRLRDRIATVLVERGKYPIDVI